ncbi:MAG TPA: M10 family metallopeptidase C-terminal domain-containing protein, partial [Alphaproteobacteria bacterium]|nr:M10 family metallopeptidase C-terminal domain-containing protein [Alphaproteobacteria bacterium]
MPVPTTDPIPTAAPCGCGLCAGVGPAAAASGHPTLSAQSGPTSLLPNHVGALLFSDLARWSGSVGSGATVTYSFLTAPGSGQDAAGFAPMTAAQRAAVQAALQLFASVCDLTFVQLADGAGGQIRLGTNRQDGVSAAYAYAPGSGVGGDVYLANDERTNANMEPGGYGFLTVLHEIGHAIGLKHPGDYDALGGGGEGPYLPPSLDSASNTVMSYFSNAPHPASLGPFDISAAQYLYGVNPAARPGNDTYVMGSPGGNLIWDGSGTDTLSAASQIQSANITLVPGQMSWYGDRPGHVLEANAVTINHGTTIERALGGSGDDTIVGNAAANSLSGGSGNDWLDGGAGSDTLEGGAGTDFFIVAAGQAEGDLLIDYTPGTDRILFLNYSSSSTLRQIGNAVFLGSDSTEALRLPSGVSLSAGDVSFAASSAIGTVSTNGDDALLGTAADDIIDGLLGNDAINGAAGNDTLLGGGGDDILAGSRGSDRLEGGAGFDTVSYAIEGSEGSGTSGVSVNLLQGTAIDGFGGFDILIDVEQVEGSLFSDTLVGNSAANGFRGESGRDFILGGDGNDTLAGGIGDDTLHGGGGTDLLTYAFDVIELAVAGCVVDLSAGTATDPFGGADALTGFEQVAGTGLGDTLAGGAAGETLAGNGGDDVLGGGAGNDSLDGGAGIDAVTFAAAGSGVAVNLALGRATADGQGGQDTLAGIENVIGGGFGDTLIGSAAANVFIGGAGNDSLDGGDGIDAASYATAAAGVAVSLALGRASADGQGGEDTLAGIENVIGSGFADALAGDALANLLIGGGGNDSLDGGAGNDSLDGGAGTDTVVFAAAGSGVAVNLALGRVTADGQGGQDTLAGIENVTGSGFADALTGDAGGNALNGGAGDDTLVGGAGNDLLDGGGGANVLNGGADNDVYLVRTASTQVVEAAGGGIDTV